MIKTIIFVTVSAAVVGGSVWLADYPGTMTIAWYGGLLEIALPVVFFGLLIFGIVIGLLYRLWWTIRRAPRAISTARKNSKRERGYRALTQGMVAVAAGDSNEARRQAQKADNYLGAPPLTMLLSAQAAQLSGDEAAATRYFESMLKRQETAFLGLRGLLMQAERDGDGVAALTYAARANTLKPKTPWVLTKLFELQVQQLQWKPALVTLDHSIKANSIKLHEGEKLRAVVLLGCSIEAEISGDQFAALSYAEQAHRERSKFLPAALRRAQLMSELGKTRGLTKLIRETWGYTPHPILAEIYAGEAVEKDPLLRVKKLEELRELNPNHPESAVALVSSLIDAKIWGAARTHLEELGTERPSSRFCRLMAELEEGQNQDTEKVRYWLVRATSAPPDGSWVCSGCGSSNISWTPLCDRCGSLGTLEWRAAENITSTLETPTSRKLPNKGTYKKSNMDGFRKVVKGS